MRDAGAQITTSESILYQIMRASPSSDSAEFLVHSADTLRACAGDSDHPGFKALTGLIKEYDPSTRDSLQKLIAGRGF